MQKWIKINRNDYLIFTSTGTKFTSSMITRRFNQLFGKKASTNILRHSYLSERYGDIQAEIKETAKKMGHDLIEQGLYIKH